MKRELLFLIVGLILFVILRSGSLPFAAEPEVAEGIPAIDSTTPVIVPAQPEIQYDKTVVGLSSYRYASGNPVLSYDVSPARVKDGSLVVMQKKKGSLGRLDVLAERERSAVFAEALDGFHSALVLLAEEKVLAAIEEPTPEQVAELAAVRLALGIKE